MSTLGGLARFTPRLLDRDTLEALFVHREHLVVDAVERIERAARSKERSCRLFVGPRGAGKTHLVSLVYHRAKDLPGFGERFQLSWLPEDLWAIGSYEDLLREVLKRLEPPDGLGVGQAPLADPAGEVARRVAERGPIVIIIENLDTVLDDIGADGQRRLRAAIESDRSLLLVATATKLTSAMLDQSEPFYGFFDAHDLQAFDVEQATEMLQRIAAARGDDALIAALEQPYARARLAAVAHLAGGQPRIWALFGAGLTVEGLDDLVSVLIERFDDLTPYYQEQLRRLSVNERKAVQTLAEADRPMPVKELAELTGIGERSLGSTMTKLRNAGWVKPRTGRLVEMADGRLTYYELAEPLARLAFQLKSSNGEPVRLVVDFLRLWFDSAQLAAGSGAGRARSYLRAALDADDEGRTTARIARWISDWPDLLLAAPAQAPEQTLLRRLDEALADLDVHDPEPLLDLPTAIVSVVEARLAELDVAGVRCVVHAMAIRSTDPYWQDVRDGLLAESGDDEEDWLFLSAIAWLLLGEIERCRWALRRVHWMLLPVGLSVDSDELDLLDVVRGLLASWTDA